MAELNRYQSVEKIYSTLDDGEIIPLFVRYTNDDANSHDKDAAIPFGT